MTSDEQTQQTVTNNLEKQKTKEDEKEDILLPYTLDVVETLRELEGDIKKEYMGQKNSSDLKSLTSGKNIEIKIKKDGVYSNIVKKVKEYCKKKHVKKEKEIKIVLLILARILHYDGKLLWTKITDLVDKNAPIPQPFYEFKRDNDSSGFILVIKDHMVIPKDFVAAYFGYDTGIDGLNLLMNGGFLLPPDRSAYISVSGEAGIGKTALVLKLVTSFFHNYNFKNVYYEETQGENSKKKEKNPPKDLERKFAKPLSIHYILMEQKKENIIRLIKECNLIALDNKNVDTELNENSNKTETKEKTVLVKNGNKTITEDGIEKVIHFVEEDWFSPMGLIEKIDSIEKPKDGKLKGKRNVIVIDSVNAIQEIDINRTEWRELFQSIKAITKDRNTIVFFIVEKNPEQPDSTIEYLSDVVLKLHKSYQHEAYTRIIELVESRFQKFHHGKHTLFITRTDSGFIRVYPSSAAIGDMTPPRKRVYPSQTGELQNEKEVGIKIDGIINFFKYSHRYETRMEPFFLKNSISMFTGDRGSHKSAFAQKFALSAFRDERWEISSKETDKKEILEFDYREREANKPWEEICYIGFRDARPMEKAIALFLYFSENYGEDPKNDIIWETYFGKVIIPGCKLEEKRYIGYISHFVCSYEVKDLNEDIYLYQLDELIRTIESCKVTDIIPDSYSDFINRKSISLQNRVVNDGKQTEGNIYFNPYNIIYKGEFVKNLENIPEDSLKNDIEKCKDLNITTQKIEPPFDEIFKAEKLDLEKIKNKDKIKDKHENKFKEDIANFDYKDVKRIKVSRMILDDAENLENVYTTVDPRKYISTLAHICLAREITLGIVNTRSKDVTSEVDTVCSAVSDNAFKFEKYFFKGELFTTFSIIRSATSFHNNMLYYISKRDDGLLQLKNAFSLLSHVEKQNPEPIEIRLFLPELSNKFRKTMYRLLSDRDRFFASLLETNPAESPNVPDFAKCVDFSSEFNIKYGNTSLETTYKLHEKFPSIYKEWHEFLKDMITYSLAHPKVEIFTANDPFTDISIILDDESAKDAISILCLPGYLMDLYEKNLASISDYVHFPGEEDNVPVMVYVNNDGKWVSFTKTDNGNKIKFGNEFHYLKNSVISVPKYSRSPDERKNEFKHTWIVPEILFNLVIARDENTNKILKRKYKDTDYLDIKGYPYYIDPRVNLVISTQNENKKSNKPDYFIHNSPHDFVALFFELWFEEAKCETPKNDYSTTSGEPSCREYCNFCFFEQAERSQKKDPNQEDNQKAQKRETNEKENHKDQKKIKNLVDKFVEYVKRSVEFNRDGLIHNINELVEGKRKEIVLREWYSSAQQKLRVLEPFLFSLSHKEKKQIHVKLEIPNRFLYTTWFLAIPVNSPRKETASEIIINVTQPHDLAFHQISGIGLQLSERFYDKKMEKFFPAYNYKEILEAMENLITDSNSKDNNENKKLGIPVDSIHCYLEHLTLLGGILADFYKYYKNTASVDKDFKLETLSELDKKIAKELTKKLITFGSKFKKWQRDIKKRCGSCYMTHLFHGYQGPQTKKENSQNPSN